MLSAEWQGWRVFLADFFPCAVYEIINLLTGIIDTCTAFTTFIASWFAREGHQWLLHTELHCTGICVVKCSLRAF